MARKGTLDHPKTLALASELGIEAPHALGLLEALWHFAYYYAPQGDIGRYSDAVITGGIRTSFGAAEIIPALVRCGWIDIHPDPAVRLCIHDWADHNDNSTKKKLSRANKDAIQTPERLRPGAVPDAVPDAVQTMSTRANHPIPSHSIPSHSIPKEEEYNLVQAPSAPPEGSPKLTVPLIPSPSEPEQTGTGASFEEVAARIKAKAEAAERGELAPDGEVKAKRRTNGKHAGPVPVAQVLAEAAE